LKQVGRTYVQAVSGHAKSMKFDTETNIFQLSFIMNTNCKLPTEIFLNYELNYQSGINVELSPSGIAQWTQSENKNFIYISPLSLASDGKELQITISPQ